MKFEQLSEKAKDRVRSNFGDEMLSTSFWYEWLLDEFVDKISSTYNVEINKDKIYFNVGYSQSDHVTFTIDDLNYDLVKEYIMEIANAAEPQDKEVVYDALVNEDTANGFRYIMTINSHGSPDHCEFNWMPIIHIAERLMNDEDISVKSFENIDKKYDQVIDQAMQDIYMMFASEAKQLYHDLRTEADSWYNPDFIDDMIIEQDLDYTNDGKIILQDEANKKYLKKING